MDYQHLYQGPSGLSAGDFTLLGQRFEKGTTFAVGFVDTWILDCRAGRLVPRQGLAGWFTMLWRSPTARLYASQSEGFFHVFSEKNGRLVSDRHPIPAPAMGVWGLDDSSVYVWTNHGPNGRLFHWNGKALQEMPSPGKIVRMHGLSPDSLYAVGQSGLIAFWNGRTWHRFALPTQETFLGIWAVGNDEFYAAGYGWTFVEGSGYGCRVRAVGPGPLHDVAVWGGEVWVAGHDCGLLQLERGKPSLAIIDPAIPALSFDARGELLIGCSEFVCSTTDGKKFEHHAEGALSMAIDRQPPLWKRPPGATVTP